MPNGVVADTSFLITLADSSRAHHQAARQYWRYFLDTQIPIYLSSIVVSEFCMKQEIPPDILRCCIVQPFNWNDALRAAKLDWRQVRPSGIPRDALKDDIKIIAQAVEADVEFVITDDSKSFFVYCATFKNAGQIHFNAIKLEDGFDSSLLNPDGQRDLLDGLDDMDELTRKYADPS